jgi:nitrate reductase (NAD(P)H)
MRDGQGTFTLVVKTYFPTTSQPGGAMSNILDTIPLGESVDIRGPTGSILYNGQSHFTINSMARNFRNVNLVLGGSGITPGYAMLARAVLGNGEDMMRVRVVDGNKSQRDILLRSDLQDLETKSEGRLKVTHVLSHPEDGWDGLKGHVDAHVLRDHLFDPDDETVTFLCGPPGMIQKSALPALIGMLFLS